MNLHASSGSPVIETEHLEKTFRDFWLRPKVEAVRGINLCVRRGEIFGLLGPNGSGKSTTIKMLLGLLRPTAGRIRILENTPNHAQTRSRIGYLPEESYLYPYLTAEETLAFYGRLHGLKGHALKTRIRELLERVGLAAQGSRVVGTFSKGMARRVGLAQALINRPELVILDEPTSGLDPLGTREVKDLLLGLAREGRSVLLTSHLLADVEDVCSRIAILHRGQVRAEGCVDELLKVSTRTRFTFNGLSGDEETSLAEVLKQHTGQAPEVDHPRRDLESFFLETIRGSEDRPEHPDP